MLENKTTWTTLSVSACFVGIICSFMLEIRSDEH